MKALRTPEERFEGLTDFPFAPNYHVVGESVTGPLRVHYIDEGPRDADPVLLMHGEPSWSYLYRKMIPVLVDAGHRVIAPDLVGFGKSDKPTEKSDYTYARHVSWMAELLFDHLSIRHATFFGQDWGGLVGLRLVASAPERFARLVLSNTGLPTGEQPLSEAFMAWQKFSVPDRHDRQRWIGNNPPRRRHRGVRRTVPRRLLQGWRAHLPVTRPDVDVRPRTPRQPHCVGCAAKVRTSGSLLLR
ncbi:MAG: haloalkane dehalogenase [Actinomycetota bacterium]